MMTSSNLREFTSEELECVPSKEKTLGQGGFGTVVMAFHVIHNLVAIKCFQKVGGERKEKILEKKFKKELGNLQKCNHENVVRVIGWIMNSNVFGIVTEYLPGGNLMELVEDEDAELGPLLKLRICVEVANGLAFIHNFSKDCRLIHGDIKPENVLLTEDFHCKIADFGSAKISTYTGESTLSKTGTASETGNQFTDVYAAPELLRHPLMQMKPSIDTYSYGMLVYVVLGRRVPNINRDLFKQTILSGERPELNNIFTITSVLGQNCDINGFKVMEALTTAMMDCWQQDPSNRPTMKVVKEKLYIVLAEFSPSDILQSVMNSVQQVEVSIPLRKHYNCIPFHKLQIFNVENQPLDSSSFSLESSSTQSSSVSNTRNIQSNIPSATSSKQASSIVVSQSSESNGSTEILDLISLSSVSSSTPSFAAANSPNQNHNNFTDPVECCSFTSSPTPSTSFSDPQQRQSNVSQQSLESSSCSSSSTPSNSVANAHNLQCSVSPEPLDSCPFSSSTAPSTSVANTKNLQCNVSKQISELLRSLKSSLEKNNTKEAVFEAYKLISIDILHFGNEAIVDDIIAAAKSLTKKSEFLASIKLVEWCSDISRNMESLEARFQKLHFCCHILHSISFSSWKAQRELDNQYYCLSILNKVLEILKGIKIKDTTVKTDKETMCLLYIGWVKTRIGSHQESIEMATSCLSNIKSQYGADTTKHRTLPNCYALLAGASHNKGDYERAIEYWKSYIEAIRTSKYISDKDRKKWIEVAQDNLSRSQAELLSRN